MEFSNVEMDDSNAEDCNQYILDPSSVIVLDDLSQLVTLDDGTVIQIVEHNLAGIKNNEDATRPPVVEFEMNNDMVSSIPTSRDDMQVKRTERERLDLPKMVEATYRPSEGLVIIARERIGAKMTLGKVIAPRSSKNFIAKDIFILKEVHASGPTLCLDTGSDEDDCNWLCNVQIATSAADQNCEAIQVGDDIYYRTTRDVEIGEELKVWYSENYAALLGASAVPFPGMKNMRTARSRYGSRKSFHARLLSNETPVLSRCRVCNEYSSNLSDHICPALRTGKCPRCSTVCPSLADHVCHVVRPTRTLLMEESFEEASVAKRLLTVHPCETERFVVMEGLPMHNSKKRGPGGRGRDPEWRPGGVSITKAKRGRGRPPSRVEPTGKRRRGRPRKFPLVEEATSSNDAVNAGGAESGIDRRLDVRGENVKCRNVTEVIDDFGEKSLSPSPSTVNYRTSVDFATTVSQPAPSGSQLTPTVSKLEPTVSQPAPVPEEAPTSPTIPISQTGATSVPPVALMSEALLSDMDETLNLVENFREIYVEIVKDTYSDEYDDNSPEIADNNTAETTQCAVCMKDILDPEALLSHVEKHNTQAFCSTCAVFFPDMATFTNHDCRDPLGRVVSQTEEEEEEEKEEEEDGDIGVGNFRTTGSPVPADESKVCLICETAFSTEEELNEHVGIVHSEQMDDVDRSVVVSIVQAYSCDRCTRDFRTLPSFLNHLMTCNQSQLSTIKTHDCERCPQVFACEKHLELHRKCHDRYFACSDCRKQFSSEDSRAIHACGADHHDDGLVTKDRPFCCGECEKKFKTQFHLNLHLDQHSRVFACDSCDNVFRKRTDLDSHVILCKAEKVVQARGVVRCGNCSMEFTDASVYYQHYLTHQAPYSCQFCSKPYRYLCAKEAHQQSCQLNEQRREVPVEPVNCQHCFKTFSNPVRLKRHMVFHKKPQFDCAYCNRQFHRRDYYQNHMCQRPDGSIVRAGLATATKKKVDHVCPICGNQFVSSSNRNKHMLLHREKQLACDVCGKKFHLPHSLRAHKRFVHSKKMEAQCPRCDKKLKSRACLNVHLRLVHNKDASIHYPCPVCDRAFNQRSNMLKHMLKHAAEKTFHCKLCPSSFRYPDQFSRHMIEHKDGKRFSCAECEKAFVRENELRRHAAIFHSERIYACEHCDFESRHDNALRRHLKQRHPRLLPKVTAQYLRSSLKPLEQGKSQTKIPNSAEEAAESLVVVDSQVDSDVTHMILDQSEESVSLPAQMVQSMSGKPLRIELDGHALNFGPFELEKMNEIAELE